MSFPSKPKELVHDTSLETRSVQSCRTRPASSTTTNVFPSRKMVAFGIDLLRPLPTVPVTKRARDPVPRAERFT